MYQRDPSSHATVLHITAAGISDKGRVRSHNEDAIGLYDPPAGLEHLGKLYVLADGAGGHAAGEVASALAIETIPAIYYHQTIKTETGIGSSLVNDATPVTRLQDAFLAANARIQEMSARNLACRGMVTTCIAAAIQAPHVTIAHLGDSRAYLMTHGSQDQPTIRCLTTDHSLAVAFAQAGIIPPEQTRQSPSRHVILRSLGSLEHFAPGPVITTVEVQAGDSLLLCCDGLWSMVSEEQIIQVMGNYPPQAACAELIRLANDAGGEDNSSAIIVSFHL
jgi:serine/threonine protein phosphatase PrpC